MKIGFLTRVFTKKNAEFNKNSATFEKGCNLKKKTFDQVLKNCISKTCSKFHRDPRSSFREILTSVFENIVLGKPRLKFE